MGVDVIIVDLTNAVIYLPQLKTSAKYIRRSGKQAEEPRTVIHLQHAGPGDRPTSVRQFYAKGLYKDLWFYWKGKPQDPMPPQDVTPQFADFFTIRHSWFCSLPEWEWLGDGRDKWPWAD